jgi:hypothetical protein
MTGCLAPGFRGDNEVCDACKEIKDNPTLCSNCIVCLLQSEKYFI